MKKLTVINILNIILFFSCSSGEIIEKDMKIDEYGNYCASDNFYLISEYSYYGLRMKTDEKYSGNLENIYLYDGVNKKEYIVHNTETLEKIINEKFPQDIVIYYYVYCTSGSGVDNEENILLNINSILINNKIKFFYRDENEYPRDHELWEPKLNKISICICKGG